MSQRLLAITCTPVQLTVLSVMFPLENLHRGIVRYRIVYRSGVFLVYHLVSVVLTGMYFTLLQPDINKIIKSIVGFMLSIFYFDFTILGVLVVSCELVRL